MKSNKNLLSIDNTNSKLYKTLLSTDNTYSKLDDFMYSMRQTCVKLQKGIEKSIIQGSHVYYKIIDHASRHWYLGGF